ATNMSDLAAKGAVPLGVLLGCQLGPAPERFLAGLREALAHYGAALLGGDTVAGPGPQALGLTAIGRASFTPVPSRGGARPGDRLWLTGALGGAMVGLEALRGGSGDSLAYRRPAARVAEGIALAPLVTAMMDVSDGLLLDTLRLARASGVAIAIDSAAVPLACPAPRRAEALRWGDDYELLFTLPAGVACPVDATAIGVVEAAGAGCVVLDGQSFAEPDRLGFMHG
ncbi:MAG: thiamine-monophosphate kinase, partial [Sphingomonadales bacterium]|nr:thiamine-monophosphate kinase [Sphingomonadales bacterium]